MSQRVVLGWAVTVLFGACQCGPLGLETRRFACSTDEDCAPGLVCADRGSGRECGAPGAGGGAAGGSSGGAAGGAGGGDAGGDAGGMGGGAAGGDAGGMGGGDSGGAAGGDAGGSAGGAAGGASGGSGGGAAGGGASGGSAGGTAGGGGRAGGSAGGGSAGGAAGGAVAGGAGGGGRQDGGTADGGFGSDAGVGPPTALVFTNSPRNQATFVCSSSITVEARDSNNARVSPTPPLTVTIGITTPDSGVSFYAGGGCTGQPISTVNLTAAAPTALLSARGIAMGNYTMTASSPPLTPASQLLQMAQGPDTLVFTNSPPANLRGAQCFPLTYQTRLGAMVQAPPSNTTVSFSSTAAVRFYADPSCTVTLSSQTLAGGQSIDTVYVRVLAPTGTITASAPFDSDSLPFTASPIVRRGQCVFPPQVAIDGGFDPDGGAIDGGFSQTTSITCSLGGTVVLGSTMLLVQQTGAQPGDHNDVMARCRLSSPTQVSCTRRQGAHGLDVRWQTVELGEGLRVQALASSSCPTSIALPQPVDAGSAFVLRTLNTNVGGYYDDEDATPFVLAGSSTVLAPPPMCGGYDLQVVEWGGTTVTRGALDAGLAGGVVSTTVMPLSPAGMNKAVLLQAAGTGQNDSTCAPLARATLPGPSELGLFRAMGDAGCAIAPLPLVTWERIDFGARATVQERTLTFGPNVFQSETTIIAVDAARTFVFSSNQSAMGQGLGETDALALSKPAEAAFWFDLPTPTLLRATRARATANARVTVYVVQVE
ncbi:MAG: hypothetical protein SFW67_25530 [Myxococcaceae bacterium]|nr:hypothetical protein [Myxococcaceae bacterium]